MLINEERQDDNCLLSPEALELSRWQPSMPSAAITKPSPLPSISVKIAIMIDKVTLAWEVSESLWAASVMWY